MFLGMQYQEGVVVCAVMELLHYDALASLRLRCVWVFSFTDGTPYRRNLVDISAFYLSVRIDISENSPGSPSWSCNAGSNYNDTKATDT